MITLTKNNQNDAMYVTIHMVDNFSATVLLWTTSCIELLSILADGLIDRNNIYKVEV